MSRKATISLDLAAFVGNAEFVPGVVLPRHDKRLLERTVAMAFLEHYCLQKNTLFSDLDSTVSDPPDVTFRLDGELRGMELAELVPERRFEKDAILQRLRRDILSELDLGSRTANVVVNVFFADDYSAKLRPGRIQKAISRALREYFESAEVGEQVELGLQSKSLSVPSEVASIVSRILVTRSDLARDPRVNDPREPLILFGAQSTRLVPEEDFPAMVESLLSRKRSHDLALPTWLLFWSFHPALFSFRDGIDAAIATNLQKHSCPHERVFHLHLFSGSGATEFLFRGKSIAMQ